jgi:hypothetical protein
MKKSIRSRGRRIRAKAQTQTADKAKEAALADKAKEDKVDNRVGHRSERPCMVGRRKWQL